MSIKFKGTKRQYYRILMLKTVKQKMNCGKKEEKVGSNCNIWDSMHPILYRGLKKI